MTKEKAQELIQVMKRIIKVNEYSLPSIGETNSIPLQSESSTRDKFKVYVNRKSRIVEGKYTLLLHYPEEDLLRIDVNGRDHMNPDGTIVPCPHIHMRSKDTGPWDRWAFDLPAVFGDTEDCLTTLKDFLQYCHVNNISQLIICEQKEFLNGETGS